jgi:PPOX class probable F420-dependent enzyme
VQSRLAVLHAASWFEPIGPVARTRASGKVSPEGCHVNLRHLAGGVERTGGEIPETHRDLAECPPVAALSTVMPNGDPQTSVVWCDTDGDELRVNTMAGFQKERNMRRDPRVTLLCYDPRRPLRSLEIRGRVVDMTEVGAAAHLDQLSSKYAGRPVRYFGDVVPAALAATERPVLCRIRPTRVVALDATERRNR